MTPYFTSRPSPLPLCRQPPYGPRPVLTAKGRPANQPKRLGTKSHYIRLLLLLSLWQLKTAPSTQLASLLPVTLHSSFSSSCLSQLVTQSHRHTQRIMCNLPTTSVLHSHLARFTVSRISHQFILHTATAMIRLPHHSLASKAVTVPLLSDVTISTGDSVSFRTWPSLNSSNLPRGCANLAPPDSSFQITECSSHLHICCCLRICPKASISHLGQTLNVPFSIATCDPLPAPTQGMSSSLCPSSVPDPLIQSRSHWNHFG